MPMKLGSTNIHQRVYPCNMLKLSSYFYASQPKESPPAVAGYFRLLLAETGPSDRRWTLPGPRAGRLSRYTEQMVACCYVGDLSNASRDSDVSDKIHVIPDIGSFGPQALYRCWAWLGSERVDHGSAVGA